MAHHLRYLLQCYFHEDWYEDAPTWDGVVRFFVEVEPDIDELVRALGELTIVEHSQFAAGERMYEVYIFAFWPFPLMPMREWLVGVRDELAVTMRWERRLPAESASDLEQLLERHGVRRSASDADLHDQMRRLGDELSLDLVITLLAEISLLDAKESIDVEQRERIRSTRAALAQHVVARWEAEQLASPHMREPEAVDDPLTGGPTDPGGGLV